MMIVFPGAPARLSFAYADLPDGWANVSSCAVYDVWRRAPLGRFGAGVFGADGVASRDSVFLTLSACA